MGTLSKSRDMPHLKSFVKGKQEQGKRAESSDPARKNILSRLSLLGQPQIGLLVHNDISAFAVHGVQNAQKFVGAWQRIDSHAVVVYAKEKSTFVNPAAQGIGHIHKLAVCSVGRAQNLQSWLVRLRTFFATPVVIASFVISIVSVMVVPILIFAASVPFLV